MRVLPTEFTEEAFAMLPAAWRTQIRTLLMLRRRPTGSDDETPFSKLEKGVLTPSLTSSWTSPLTDIRTKTSPLTDIRTKYLAWLLNYSAAKPKESIA